MSKLKENPGQSTPLKEVIQPTSTKEVVATAIRGAVGTLAIAAAGVAVEACGHNPTVTVKVNGQDKTVEVTEGFTPMDLAIVVAANGRPLREYFDSIKDHRVRQDTDGNWVVFDHGCELIFQNAKWGFKTLPEFLEKIDQKATANVLLSAKWWRPATLQYHWYQSSNGQRYTDFITESHMPDMLIINYSLGALAEIDYCVKR